MLTRTWPFAFAPLIIAVAIASIAAFRARRRLFRSLGEESVLRRLVDPLAGRRQRVKAVLAQSALILLLAALVGPRWGRQFQEARRSGLDVMVAVDVSASMLAEDVEPNRLTQAKRELGLLLQRLKGDRVGLIAFAGQATLQCPLTLDYDAAQSLLELIGPSLVPTPGTSLADAIDLGRESFPAGGRKHKALVLLTDGEDHTGRLPEAVERARNEGLRLFVIGFGSPKGEIIPVRDAQGNLREYKKDRSGQTVVSKLNEAALADLAAKTDGKYYRATRGEVEVDRLLQDLSEMERKILESRMIDRFADRFQWPLCLALLLMIAEFLWPETRGHWRWCVNRFRQTWAHRKRFKWRPAKIAAAVYLSMAMPQEAPAMGRMHQGHRAYKRSDYARAAERYKAAAERAPDNAAAHFNLGAALYRAEDYTGAQEAFERARAAAEEPTMRGQSSYNLGNAVFRKGNYAEAADHYKEALRQNPHDFDAKHNLELARKLLKNSGEKTSAPDTPPRPSPEQSTAQPAPMPENHETPDERPQMSKEDAERLLKAIEDQEQKARREAIKTPRSAVNVEHDW